MLGRFPLFLRSYAESQTTLRFPPSGCILRHLFEALPYLGNVVPAQHLGVGCVAMRLAPARQSAQSCAIQPILLAYMLLWRGFLGFLGEKTSIRLRSFPDGN